jgi:Spy/CpxP family protein refolding chaperone
MEMLRLNVYKIFGWYPEPCFSHSRLTRQCQSYRKGKTMRIVNIAFLFLGVLWNSQIVLAQPPPMPDNPEQQIQTVIKTIQLNPEQKSRVKAIREASRNRLQSLRDDLDKRRKELNQLLDSDGDDEAVRQAFRKLQSVKTALETARFERMLAIRAVLSDQQKSAFQNLRQKARTTYSTTESPETRRE